MKRMEQGEQTSTHTQTTFQKKGDFTMKSLLWIGMAGLLCLPTMGLADVYTYNFSDRLVSNEHLSNDGWIGDDLSNWVVGDGSDVSGYARNQNNGDNTITRANDADFSYTIAPGATSFTLEMTARTGAGFWQAGLCNSSGGQLIGIGGDFNNSNKYFIFEGSRYVESGTSATGDAGHTLRLEVDMLANGGNGSADLYYDNTLIIDDQALTLPDMTTATGLFVRTSSRYVGPASFTLTTVPEPATMAVLGMGGLLTLVRRRRSAK